MPGEENKDHKTGLKWCQGVRFTGESGQQHKKHETEPKWCQRRVRFTGEYCSGIVSGLGWGIMISAYPMHFECVRSFDFFIGLAAGLIHCVGVEFGCQSQRDRREGRIVYTEADETKRMWRDGSRLWLMGEYFAGIITGFGLGIIVLICLPANLVVGFRWTLAVIAGFVLLVIGSSIHRDIRQQRAVDSSIKD